MKRGTNLTLERGLENFLDETADRSRSEPEKPALVSRDRVLQIRDIDVDGLDDEEALPVGLGSVLELDVERDTLRETRKKGQLGRNIERRRTKTKTDSVVERNSEKSLVLEVDKTGLLVHPVGDVSSVESKPVHSNSEGAIVVGS